jgi:hypothetical protein
MYLVWLIAMVFCNTLIAQTNVRLFSNAFQTIPEHKKIVVLGESHIERNFIQQSDAIKYFCEVRGFKNVFFEDVAVYEGWMQNYVSGVNNDLKDTEFWRKPDKNTREEIALLEEIRRINTVKPLQDQIHVHCYDLFSQTFEQDFRKGILALFPDTTQISSLPWFSVLNNDGYIEKCDLFHVWWNLETMRDNGSRVKFGMSDEQWRHFLKCIMNIETAYHMYSFDNKEQILAWQQREDQLYSNIVNCSELLNGSIIFCGADHAELNGGIQEDILLNERFTERLKSTFNERVCSILPHYARLGPIPRNFDPEISYFIPHAYADSLLNKNDYLKLIANIDLPNQAPAKDKCDYVLIINIRKSKKVYKRHKHYNLPQMNSSFSEWYSIHALIDYFFDPSEWNFNYKCDL